VDSYRILYGSFVDRTDPEYKGPNQIINFARFYRPEDRAVQNPNSDTPSKSGPAGGPTRPASMGFGLDPQSPSIAASGTS
jgi:hypothetical protein